MTSITHCRAAGVAICLAAASTMAAAQTAEEARDTWRESAPSLPTKLNLDRVVTFELGRSGNLTFGIEPDTLRIDSDGVVRYAFVARSASGAVNVLYEGVRCQTGEVKLYAHWDQGIGWTWVANSEWKPLSFQGTTRRAMQMARGGICAQSTPNGSPTRILDTLRNGNTDQLR